VAEEIRGGTSANGLRFAVVVAEFNSEVTSGLLAGARAALAEADVAEQDVTIVRVPGAFEIPLAAMRLAEADRFDAVICLGCLIKGDTMHFEYIASAAASGIMQAAMATGVPVTFGVLTTLTEEQAHERSRPGAENKGREAALAAVQMATLMHGFDTAADASLEELP
jgi:6,7-dimethyl-8-ribityllumazine synthase